MDASTLPMERYGAQKYWANSWGRPPILKYVRNSLYGKLIFLFDCGFSLMVSPYFTQESSLALSSNASLSLSIMGSEAFYIHSVPGYVSPSLQVFVNCFPKRPIHYKHVCDIHLGWRLSPCQPFYIIQASCLATITYHLALSMSVTASSANNIGSEAFSADELKMHIAGNWDLQTNAGRGGKKPALVGRGTGAWNTGLKTRKPASDHRRHALHFRPDSSDKRLVMYSPK